MKIRSPGVCMTHGGATRGDALVARSMRVVVSHTARRAPQPGSPWLNWIGAILAAPLAYREPFDYQQAAAFPAAAESELVAAGQRHRQKYCVFERDLRRGDCRLIRLERITQLFTTRHGW